MPTETERIQEVTLASAAGKPKIALDTCCVQYYINNPPVQPWADCLDPVFQAALDGRIELYVSTVVISELLAHVHFAHRNDAGYDPELDFLAIMNRHFRILDVNDAVTRAAGRLRGNFVRGNKITLKTPDALIGATSLTYGHTLFITNDAQLADAFPGTNCVYLRDVALEWLCKEYPEACFSADDPVISSKRGKGLPIRFSRASLELGVVQPDPAAKWRRILHDAQTVAATVNESCVFFILTEKNKRKVETREVVFWNENMSVSRPPKKVIRRLYDHLGYSNRTHTCANEGNNIYGIIFASLAHERELQNQPGFASKSDHQKETDAWNAYLTLWRTYWSCLDLPQVTWLLCEEGIIRILDITYTSRFLNNAKNVLGWGDCR